MDVEDAQTCDRCGPAVKAYFYADKGDHELSFCGHCGVRFQAGLLSAGWVVSDYTYLIGAN